MTTKLIHLLFNSWGGGDVVKHRHNQQDPYAQVSTGRLGSTATAVNLGFNQSVWGLIMVFSDCIVPLFIENVFTLCSLVVRDNLTFCICLCMLYHCFVFYFWGPGLGSSTVLVLGTCT